MIVTVRKELSEILRGLEFRERVYVIGCAGCATLCQTGGEKEAKEFGAWLVDHGKELLGWSVLDVPCDERVVKLELRKKPEILKSDVLVVMACGAGVQAIRNMTGVPIFPVLDSVFLGTIERIGVFKEYCSICGSCMIETMDNLCPVTRCAKGLLNGPCGGMVNGKCEIDPDMDCVWGLIYDTLKQKGELKTLEAYQSPRNYSKKYEILRGFRKQ